MPEATVPFFLEPILLNMEGWRYVGPLLTATLTELVSGRRGGGSRSGGVNISGGRNRKCGKGYGRGGGGGGSCGDGRDGGRGGDTSRGGAGGGAGGFRSTARVQVRYDLHLSTLYLWDREK